MTSQYALESKDNTTDALPSPSSLRNDNKNFQRNSDNTDNRNDEFEETNTYTNASTTHSTTYSTKTKTRGFTKVKRTSPPTAYASVININNSKYIHVGAKVTYNYSNGSETTEGKTDVIETNSIKALLKNQRPVTEEDLSFVATHVDEKWQSVGRALGFSNGQIEQFILDHKQYGIKEVIYQLLLDWSRNDLEATVAKLSNVLWEQNQKDVVNRWSEKQ